MAEDLEKILNLFYFNNKFLDKSDKHPDLIHSTESKKITSKKRSQS